MANLVELIPLLVVVLILLSAGGAEVDSIEVAVDGDRTLTDVDGAFVVGGGTTTVPAGERVDGPIYVIGGTARIAGTVEGDVTHLAGNLTVADGARIDGELGAVGGDRDVAEGATIARRTDVATAVTVERSPLEQFGFFAVQTLLLALAGGAIARRRPALLDNVGDSVTGHGLVSASIGLLAGASGIALVAFMAVTVILIPVSLLGIALAVVVVAYAYVTFGYLVGRRLPVAGSGRATVAGVVVFMVALEVLARVPVVGAVVELAATLVGIGAVLITYFGLREFEPADLPE